MSARSRVFLVLVVAALAVVSVAAPLSAKKKPARPVILDDQQLVAAGLVISDMPSGWSTLPIPPESAASATAGHCGGPNEQARAQDTGVVRFTTAGFTANPQSGPSFFESIFVFPQKKSTKAFVAANRALLTSCGTYPDSINGLAVSVVISEVSFPKIGDEVAALRFVATATDPNQGSESLVTDQIYIRKANYVVAVSQSSANGLFGAPADPNFNEEYASKALNKLGVAIQQAKQASKKGAT